MPLNVKLQRPEAMIFDLDGTLFQTETLLLPAYRDTFRRLREEGLYQGETPPVSRILGALGKLLPRIWLEVIPDSAEAVRNRANELLLMFQKEGLSQGLGELYPGVKDTLERLHAQGIRLFVASNGLEEYVKGVVRHMGIAALFEGVYSAGEYDTASKVDLVRLLLRRHRPASAWMVGDRASDVEAGAANGLAVIGCGYAGFGLPGELEGADRVIRSFPELLDLLEWSG
jgi:phosphoglycolate phosphatase-like HAD superfamily hydrolase